MTIVRRAPAFLASACLLGLHILTACACDNEYDRGSGPPPPPQDSVWESPAAAYVQKLRDKHQGETISAEEKRAAFEESGDFRDEANYAVALMRTGEPAQARDILTRLAEQHPDEYILAANLGTAYELTGDNEQALTWIRKGRQLNPESHNGTEWLHVKILQAKIAAADDPTRLLQRNVLNLHFGPDPLPVTPGELERDDEGRPLDLQAIRKALEYQLHERMFYVRPQDAVVANLLVTLGNLLALEGERERAFHVLHLAGEYSPAGIGELAPKLKALNPYDRGGPFTLPLSTTASGADPQVPLYRVAALAIALVMSVGGGLFLWYRRPATDVAGLK